MTDGRAPDASPRNAIASASNLVRRWQSASRHRGSRATRGPAFLLAPMSNAHDHSASFAALRGQLVNSRGVRLVDYVSQLTPIYWRIYLDLAVGGAALVSSVAALAVAESAGVSRAVVVVVGAACVGFWYFYVVSFIHEGLHWNLARDPLVNDRICSVLASCMIATRVDAWRPHHFEHHRSLGTIRDTETTYFEPLGVAAMLKSLSGVRAVQALSAYFRRMSGARRPAAASTRAPHLYRGLVVAVATHGLIVMALWSLGWTATALAWLAGVGGVMPLLNTIRQVLEHRADDARPDVDYARTDQGACARMFGTGWIDTLFGSAGANRHLLHHWEPQVSYTRLGDLEAFLVDTPARVIIDRRRTTYSECFRALFAAPMRKRRAGGRESLTRTRDRSSRATPT